MVVGELAGGLMSEGFDGLKNGLAMEFWSFGC
jgi:hypothetical protein